MQWYQNDFFSLCQEIFSKLKIDNWTNQIHENYVFWNVVAITINATTLKRRKLKTCISQRSKWLTKYNMAIITDNCYFALKFLVPLSECQQIVQTFDWRKNYNKYWWEDKQCHNLWSQKVWLKFQKTLHHQNRPNNGKWFLTQIQLNKLRKKIFSRKSHSDL